MKDCATTGEWHPVIIFVNDRGQRVRAVVGLAFCRPCSRKVRSPDHLFRDALAPIARTLKSERLALDWAHASSDEVKLFVRLAGRAS
jgi:hypothetical protein